MADFDQYLDAESKQALGRLLATGKFLSPEAVVQRALLLLDSELAHQEEDRGLLRWEIEKGMRSPVASGDPFERVLAELESSAQVTT